MTIITGTRRDVERAVHRAAAPAGWSRLTTARSAEAEHLQAVRDPGGRLSCSVANIRAQRSPHARPGSPSALCDRAIRAERSAGAGAAAWSAAASATGRQDLVERGASSGRNRSNATWRRPATSTHASRTGDIAWSAILRTIADTVVRADVIIGAQNLIHGGSRPAQPCRGCALSTVVFRAKAVAGPSTREVRRSSHDSWWRAILATANTTTPYGPIDGLSDADPYRFDMGAACSPRNGRTRTASARYSS